MSGLPNLIIGIIAFLIALFSGIATHEINSSFFMGVAIFSMTLAIFIKIDND